jgi:RAB protein geranylgeranyltransferase component A
MLKITQPHLFADTTASTTTRVLYRDYETRSRAVLKTIGAQRYAADLVPKFLQLVLQSMMVP